MVYCILLFDFLIRMGVDVYFEIFGLIIFVVNICDNCCFFFFINCNGVFFICCLIGCVVFVLILCLIFLNVLMLNLFLENMFWNFSSKVLSFCFFLFDSLVVMLLISWVSFLGIGFFL